MWLAGTLMFNVEFNSQFRFLAGYSEVYPKFEIPKTNQYSKFEILWIGDWNSERGGEWESDFWA